MVSYAEVKSYLSKREIPQLFESLMAGLMYHRPENHINYLQTCLDEIKAAGDPSNLQWSMFVSGKKRKSKELPPLTPKKQETLAWTDNSRQSTPLPPISAKSRCHHTRHCESVGHHNSLRSTYILYHNPPPVLAPPTVPVIFVLGGLGPKIDNLCEQVVSRLRGIVHISTCSMLRTRMTIEGFYRTTSVPACAVVDSVLQAMSMVQSSKSLLVAGFPRNRGDIEEYRSRQVRMDGVVLVDFEEEALRAFLNEEIKCGMIKMSDLETELESYKQDLISVAEYYDDKDLLTVVMGDQDSEDVVNDMVIAVDKIVETRSKLSVEESLAADFRSQRCRSNVSCPAIEASPTAETDQDNAETSKITDVDQPSLTDASDENGTGPLRETNLCLILVFGRPEIVAESIATLMSGDYDMRYIEFSDLIKQVQCGEKSKCQTKQGTRDSLIGTDRALYLLKREMLKYLSSVRVFVISGFPRNQEEAKRFEKEIGLCDAAIDLTDLGETQAAQATANVDVLNYFEEKIKRISDIGLSVSVQISRIIQLILSEKKSGAANVISAGPLEENDVTEDLKLQIAEDRSEPSEANDGSDKLQCLGEGEPQKVSTDDADEASLEVKSNKTGSLEASLPSDETKGRSPENNEESDVNQQIPEQHSPSKTESMADEKDTGSEENAVSNACASDEKVDDTPVKSEKESCVSNQEEKSGAFEEVVRKKPALVRQETFSATTQTSDKEPTSSESNKEELEEAASDKDSSLENKGDEADPIKSDGEIKHYSSAEREDSEEEKLQVESVPDNGNVLSTEGDADVQSKELPEAEESGREEVNESDEQMLAAVEEQIIKAQITEAQSEVQDIAREEISDKKHPTSGNSEASEECAAEEASSPKDDIGGTDGKEESDVHGVGEDNIDQNGQNAADKEALDGSDRNNEQEENAGDLASSEKQSSDGVCDDGPAAPETAPKSGTLFDEIKGSDTEDVEISDLMSDQQPLMEYDSADETDNAATDGTQNITENEGEAEPSEKEDQEDATEREEINENNEENDKGGDSIEKADVSGKKMSEVDDAAPEASEQKSENSVPGSDNGAQEVQNSSEAKESQHSETGEIPGKENAPDTGAAEEMSEEGKIDEDDGDVENKVGSQQSEEEEKNECSPNEENDKPADENQTEETANEDIDPGNNNSTAEHEQATVADETSVGKDGDGNSEKMSDGNAPSDSAKQETEDNDAADIPPEGGEKTVQEQNEIIENNDINPDPTSQDPSEGKEQDQGEASQNGVDTDKAKEANENSGTADDEIKEEAEVVPEDEDKQEGTEASPTDDEKEKETEVVTADDDKQEETEASPTDDDKQEETEPTPEDDNKQEETEPTPEEDNKQEETEASPNDGGLVADEENSESQAKKEGCPEEASMGEGQSENSTVYLKSASVTDRYIRSGTTEHGDVRRNGNELATDAMDISSEQRDEEQQERSTSSSRGEL